MTLNKRKCGLIYSASQLTTLASSPVSVFTLDTSYIVDPGTYRTEVILVAQSTSTSRRLSVNMTALHFLDGGSMSLTTPVDVGLLDDSSTDALEYSWNADGAYNVLSLTSDVDYTWGIWIYLYSLET